MASRYSTTPIGINNTELYEKFFMDRNVPFIRQFLTTMMAHITPDQMFDINAISHVWSLGDRYYKLADRYYGDPTLWWVIAWFNLAPTESHVSIGDMVLIPLPLEDVLDKLGF